MPIWIQYGVSAKISPEKCLVNGFPTHRTYVTTYRYNALGQLIEIDGPRTDVSDLTTFEYYPNIPEEGDNRGQLKAIINALGQRIEFSDYDANRNIIQETGWSYIYDLSNQLVRVLQGGSEVSRYAYDGAGQRVKKV